MGGADGLDDAVHHVPLPVVLCTTGPVPGRRPPAAAAAGRRVDLEARRLAWRANPPGVDDDAAAAIADRLPPTRRGSPRCAPTCGRRYSRASPARSPPHCAAAAGPPCRRGQARQSRGRLGTPGAPCGGGPPAPGGGDPAHPPGHGAGRLGPGPHGARRARRPDAPHRPAGHRQVPGRRGARECRADRPAAGRPVPDGVEVAGRDRAEPRRRPSTPPSAPVPCCSSTRPTRSSAPAPRSATRTTATPTSRPPTCCSGSTPSRGWPC